MDPLVMQLARNGTEKEKAALITTFLAYWEWWTSPKKERLKLQRESFYPVLQAFLPYLNDTEARIMLLNNMLSIGLIEREFQRNIAEYSSPENQRLLAENIDNYMRSIIGFLPAMTDGD
jgi:hypothetical protein